MGRVKIRYYTVRRGGRGFWEPTDAMRAAGFASTPCGPDGPSAWAVAERMNAAWDAYRRGQPAEPGPPPGSCAEAFARYKGTAEWARKAPRTREEWERCWRRIAPIFGDVAPGSIGLDHVSAFRSMVEQAVSLREAHRCIKVWRAAWQTWAAMGYCDREADPSFGVRNSAAPARTAAWQDREAVRLVKTAWRGGHRSLAAALAVMWDASQAPGDVRALTAAQIAWQATPQGARATIQWQRGKTGVRALTMLTRRASRILAAWLAHRGDRAIIGPVFLTRTRAAFRKNSFAEDFREVRKAAFGPDETRQMQDFRRSGVIEAINGGATPAQVARGAGNTLATSNELFATYAPPDTTAAAAVQQARKQARREQNAAESRNAFRLRTKANGGNDG